MNSLIKHILIITFGPNAAGPSLYIVLVHLPPASPSPSHILLSTVTRSLLYVPSKESIQMVAIGDEWVVMDTNKQLLWLLTVGGV